MNDVRFAFRQLAKAPGFTAVALLTLAIGIGACTAIFSVVNRVLLQPLPYPESQQLVRIRETDLPSFPQFSVSPGNFFSWRKESTSFSELAAVNNASLSLTGSDTPVRVNAFRATTNYLATLGVRVAMGRDFLPEEATAGHENVAILGYGFWNRQFAGRADILGQVIHLDGLPTTIIGVTPQDYLGKDLILPAVYSATDLQNHGGHYLGAVGRMKTGTSIAQARSELVLIAARLAKEFPDSNKGWSVKLTPLLEDTVGRVRPQLFALFASVGFLLFIGCANVANLLLVRASARSKEIAIRAALGASRARITRQLVVEHLVLAVLGGICGTLVAYWGLHMLVTLAPDSLPRSSEISIDRWALGFSFALALGTGLGFGLFPALQATRVDLNSVLKDAGRGNSDGRNPQRLRNGLVVAELMIAVILLVGAGLLMRSFTRLIRIDPGFRTKSAVMVNLSLPDQKYHTDAQQAAFAEEAEARMAQIPGVASVGVSHVLPFFSDYVLSFNIQGKEIAAADQPSTNYYSVNKGYFKAMGIPLLRGREFNGGDSPKSARVAIINESMARQYFPKDDPIGRKITVGGPDAYTEIVGIVGDVKQYGLDSQAPVQTYQPFSQQPYSFLNFVVRTTGDDTGLAAEIRAAIRSIDGDLPVDRIRPLEEIVAGSVEAQHFAMNLLAIFSGAALMLATIGIYGVMAYSVTQRTGEIGVRMALGAQRRDVLWMIVGQGARLIGIGIIAGLGGALLLTRFIASLLYGVGTADPLTLAGASLALAIAAFAACLLSARRAIRIDPIVALRGN